MRKVHLVLVSVLALLAVSAAPPALAGSGTAPVAGAPGIGDPYFPTDGNGGYDVQHYDLDLRYFPDTDRLAGTATIKATATQALTRFNLDLDGLTVETVTVNGRTAHWRRAADELIVTPHKALRKGSGFSVRVRYGGVPKTLDDQILGRSGVFPTEDGALIVGQPHVADTWFPVNDHPLDKASYRITMTVPRGLEVVANGRLAGVQHRRATSTWTWVARDPMASYLATATIGQFRLTTKRADGVTYRDAVDPALFKQPQPSSGRRYAVSGGDDSAYKRLTRTITVPAAGGVLSFEVARRTEPNWDYFFVEARPTGTENWTTLPDRNGHTSQELDSACPDWLQLHPFLAHYQSADGEGGCVPTGSTGAWHAATGASEGYERWIVDLTPYAGRSVEIALAAVSDGVVSYEGVYVDDIVGPAGRGSTSFEADSDPTDGWTVAEPPAGSPPTAARWQITDKPVSPSIGDNAAQALARGPEVVAFLSTVFGTYPFSEAGGIVDDDPGISFALENQTRPIYGQAFFLAAGDNSSVIAHELAHQWTGDHLAVQRWRDIWLNEGFATYAEWLWSEHQGNATAQQIFTDYSGIPADDPFWTLRVDDPGPEQLFAGPIYIRGAMTLHALRVKIGDAAFFRLVKSWIRIHAGGNVNTSQFQALAERVSGQDLDAFFTTWLVTPAKPGGLSAPGARTRSDDVQKELARTPLRR